MARNRESKKRVSGRHAQKVPNPVLADVAGAPAAPPVPLGAARRAIRSDIDGLSTVLEALGQRQFDLYVTSDTEWRWFPPQRQAFFGVDPIEPLLPDLPALALQEHRRRR